MKLRDIDSTLAEAVIIGPSDDADPQNPQVAVLGGAGSYSLKGLYKKAERESSELHKDIQQGRYRASAYNVKQLANTLNTIKAAHEELAQQRSKGGTRSRGIPADIATRY